MWGDKMDRRSIEELMREMLQRLECVHAEDNPQSPEERAVENPLSEMETHMASDPILANLHKDYLDAKQYHEMSVTRFGTDDPMVEAAGDMRDSADSAMSTRLIELQAKVQIENGRKKYMTHEIAGGVANEAFNEPVKEALCIEKIRASSSENPVARLLMKSKHFNQEVFWDKVSKAYQQRLRDFQTWLEEDQQMKMRKRDGKNAESWLLGMWVLWMMEQLWQDQKKASQMMSVKERFSMATGEHDEKIYA